MLTVLPTGNGTEGTWLRNNVCDTEITGEEKGSSEVYNYYSTGDIETVSHDNHSTGNFVTGSQYNQNSTVNVNVNVDTNNYNVKCTKWQFIS